MIINKLKKQIEKIDNIKKKYNLVISNIKDDTINFNHYLPNHNYYIGNINNELYNFNYDYNHKYNSLVKEHLFVGNIDMLFLLNYINYNNNILIISQNINIINMIMNNIKMNNKIYLLLINTFNIDSIILLKKKYNSMIDIYIVDYHFNNKTYYIIKKILKNKKFSSIIYDLNFYDLLLPISILLNEYLIHNGAYINRYKLEYKTENNITLCFLNILFNNFYNHNFMERYNSINYNKNNINTYYCFNNIKKTLSLDTKNVLLKYINNDINDDFILNKYNNLSNNFLQNLLIRWKIIYKSIYENFYRINKMLKNTNTNTNTNENEHKNINIDIFKGDNELIYHKIAINNKYKCNKIPITIFDIISKYNNDNLITYEQVNNYNLNAEYPDKKLLILYIQILTKISLDNKLEDFIILINGLSNYNFFIILYKLFPNLEWHIYEKNIDIDLKNVNIYNNYFDINNQILFNKKIIFISDYFDNKKNKINNMIDQVNIGIKLNADYIIMNYYIFETDINLIKSFNDLNIDKKYIINPNLKINNNELLFLKGELLLQIYTNDLILKIFIKKNNNKYELDIYNINDIKNKYYFYNIILKNNYSCYNNEYINYIPGYDNSLECIMEWNIIFNYYNKFHNISNLITITKKIFKINFKLEKLTKESFLMSKYNTIKNELNLTDKSDYNKYIKLKLWKNIIKLYINISINNQKKLISENKLNILSKKKIIKSIKYLNKYYNNDLYYYKLSL